MLPYSPDWLNTITPAAIERLGQSLRQINPKLMKPGALPNSDRLWFQGNEPYFDVVFERQGDRITWFQFTIRGQSLSWRRQEPQAQGYITTGRTNEMQVPPDLNYYAASKTIREDSQTQPQLLAVVKGILRSQPDQPLFCQMLTLLDTAAQAEPQPSSVQPS
jgi:hypothetical protein